MSFQITRIDLHHKLQLLIRICFLLDYRLLFLSFLLLLWACVCLLEKYSTKTIVVLNLKYLRQQANTYSKSAAETLKANCRDCTSLLKLAKTKICFSENKNLTSNCWRWPNLHLTLNSWRWTNLYLMLDSWRWTNLWNLFRNSLLELPMLHLRWPPYTTSLLFSIKSLTFLWQFSRFLRKCLKRPKK